MADFEIAAFAQCPPESLPDLLGRFEQSMRRLDVDPDLIREWLNGIHWNLDGSGFATLGNPLTLHTDNAVYPALVAKPYVVGYTQSAFPEIRIPWIQVSFVFENGSEAYEMLVSNPWTYPLQWKLPFEFGTAILEVMWCLSLEFPEMGVYFNDGPSIVGPWEALTSNGNGLWNFDMAVIPNRLTPRFNVQPHGYKSVALPGAIVVARLAAWSENPLDAIKNIQLIERSDEPEKST